MLNIRNLKNDYFASSLGDKIALAIIFLFPVLSLSVRHWLSGLYSVLALVALFLIFRRPGALYREEKILLALLFLFLASFFLSATLNDWSPNSFRRVGNVIKFIIFFPTYLLIRHYKNAIKYFLAGIVLGGSVLGIQAILDMTVFHSGEAGGIYGPIIFGNLGVLFYAFCTVLFLFEKQHTRFSYLLLIPILLSLLAMYLSASRNAWLAAIYTTIAIPFLCLAFIKHKNVLLAFIFIVLSLSVVVMSTDTIRERGARAYNELTTFINDGAPKDVSLLTTSVGFRLEQWRVALMIFKEKPLFGHGGGTAGKHVTRYAQKGIAHPDLNIPATIKGIGGLHSTYFESLVNEGIIGLIIILSFILYPLYIFIRYKKYNQPIAIMGILFSTNFLIFGTTENPFVHNNFSSIYLVFLGILFSTVVRSKYENDPAK